MNNVYYDRLPHVIPHPQYVMYPTKANQSTTVIIQPFISSLKYLSQIWTKDTDTQRSILSELKAFYELSELMRQTYDVFPDLGFKDNLVLSQSNGVYHLTLIDDGLIDQNANSPVIILTGGFQKYAFRASMV